MLCALDAADGEQVTVTFHTSGTTSLNLCAMAPAIGDVIGVLTDGENYRAVGQWKLKKACVCTEP